MNARVFPYLLLLGLGACGDKGKPTDAPVPSGSTAPTAAAPVKPKRGAPPADKMKGKARLVNLYVAADGKTQAVDVWIVGGMYDAQKLASVAFGKASDWFATPIDSGMQLIVVPAGADGDSAHKIASMFMPRADEQQTSMLTRDDPKGEKAVTSLATGADALTPSAPEKALVLLDANQLIPFEADLTPTYGGRSFMVADPSGTCDKNVLGGTNYLKHEVDPGKAKFTLHKWPGTCTTDPVLTIEVDAVAGKGVRVELFTPDGKKIETLTMPL